MMAFTEMLWRGVAVHLWQTSLVLVILFALGALMRTAPARLAGLLWWAGLVKLMLPLSLLTPLFGHPGRSFLHELAPPDSAAGASLQMVVLVFDPTRWSAQPPPPTPAPPSYLFLALTGLWAFVASAIVIRFIRGATRATARLPMARADVPGPVRARCDEALLGTHIPDDRLVVCADRAMPAASGWFIPRIFVPQAVVEALPVDELRGVLLHEDAHRRRRDPLLSALRSFIFALFHFYPLLWPLLARLRRNAELACDEVVLRSGLAPEVYARALARTMLLGLRPAHAPAAADPLRPSLLQERFERIHQPGRFKAMYRHRLTLLAGAALVAASFFMPEAGLAELKLDEAVVPPRTYAWTPATFRNLPMTRLHAKPFAIRPVRTTRAALGLPLGCFVGIRIQPSLDAAGQIQAYQTGPVTVLEGQPGCNERAGSELSSGVAGFETAVDIAMAHPSLFDPPDPELFASSEFVSGWFEIRWQIPDEGPIDRTETTIVSGPENDIALVLLSSASQLEVARAQAQGDHASSPQDDSGVSSDAPDVEQPRRGTEAYRAKWDDGLERRLPKFRLHVKKLVIPPIPLSRTDFGLPLGCLVGRRVQVAVNAAGKVVDASIKVPIVFAGTSECNSFVGKTPRGLDAEQWVEFGNAMGQIVDESEFTPPNAAELQGADAARGWLEVRWQLPPEGTLQWTESTILEGPEHDIAMILLPGLPKVTEGTMPRLIPESRVEPEYPPTERGSNLDGDVMLQLVIDRDGRVSDITVLQGIDGHPAFAESAVAAVKQWRFTPGLSDGRPAKVAMNITVRFATQ